MPKQREVSIPLTGLQVTDTADGLVTALADLAGVQLLVLMRHRH